MSELGRTRGIARVAGIRIVKRVATVVCILLMIKPFYSISFLEREEDDEVVNMMERC
jgi:hypothetical protein